MTRRMRGLGAWLAAVSVAAAGAVVDPAGWTGAEAPPAAQFASGYVTSVGRDRPARRLPW